MSIARFVKRLAPPVLLDVFHRNQSRSPRTGRVWEGIYAHYRDVPTSGHGFNGDVWINKTYAYTQSVLASAKKYGTIPTGVAGEHMLLPLLAAAVCREAGGKVRILDFGGGMGIAYVHLLSSLVNCGSIDYHIVESEGVCERGARLFEHDERIHFSAQLPVGLADLDILYMSSALQYVEDYPSLLKALSAFQARYFLFAKLSAGDFPTYATAQKNVPGTTLAYWFINAQEIIEIMAAGGYSLIYKSALEQQYDQSNFPEKYRMGQTCNLLFSRN
jgi:putative methyltransferase (TIGR04325 family)